jgi:hypothetical protein
MTDNNNPGENKAWDILETLKPEDVSKSADASYDPASFSYRLKSFGMNFFVNVRDRSITSASQDRDLFLQKLGYFFRISLLWYLVHAKHISCSGRLIKLENVKSGNIFTTGSHVLPLDQVANKYATDRDAFLSRGERLGGQLQKYGDVSIQLSPLPRIPATLLLWLKDEEFPARADLLFDSTCELQVPTDVLWSIAMTSVLAML